MAVYVKRKVNKIMEDDEQQGREQTTVVANGTAETAAIDSQIIAVKEKIDQENKDHAQRLYQLNNNLNILQKQRVQILSKTATEAKKTSESLTESWYSKTAEKFVDLVSGAFEDTERIYGLSKTPSAADIMTISRELLRRIKANGFYGENGHWYEINKIIYDYLDKDCKVLNLLKKEIENFIWQLQENIRSNRNNTFVWMIE